MELIDYPIKWLDGAILIFAFSKSPAVRGWCIAAMFIVLALTVMDFFSRENGERYQNELQMFQKQNKNENHATF